MRSPFCNRTLVFPGNFSTDPSAASPTHFPASQSSPPFNPHGPRSRRSASSVTSASVNTSISRTMPSPPRCLPSPPLPRRSEYCRTRRRVGIFQRLRRRVQRIRHVSMYSRDTGFGGTSAHPAGDSFVVGKGLAGTRIDSADSEIVHCPRRCRGNPIRNRLRQRPQQNVHNALRGFHISARHRCRRPRIDYGSGRCNHPDRAHQSSSCRHILRQQTSENIKTGRVGDRLNRIDAAFHLRIGAGKINDDQC